MSKTNIKPDDTTLTDQMNIILESLYDDLKEAEENVQRYKDMLSDPKTYEMNISMYGPLLNDSLKIKAAVRDKIIKMLGTLKDRVRVKEQQSSDGKSSEEMSEKDIAELGERVSKRMKEND